ncbi:MAG: thermonuclease family protein [Arenicellales bacterium]|jgi:endonuclease YncB( thermonuclease family)|nr:thermonuclease family protein [Arenicellales bacterium]|tara:strand:+ start:153 stop:569 length:417 start_codon:yes stop_codon:yes gene_type:complete
MKLFSFIFLFVFSPLTHAADYGSVNGTVLSVYDGDTFRVDISGWPPIIGKNIPVRVRGLDTPEIRGKCQAEKDLAIHARDYVRQVLASGTVTLAHLDRGKYFRIVATVLVDGTNLTELVIQKDLGRRYDGGKKQGWCE